MNISLHKDNFSPKNVKITVTQYLLRRNASFTFTINLINLGSVCRLLAIVKYPNLIVVDFI